MLAKRIIKNARAFTLMELMIVVAILGVLSAVALPYYTSVTNKSKRAEAINGLAGIYTVEIAYYSTANEWLPHSCPPGPPHCYCPDAADPLQYSKEFTAGGLNFSGNLKFYGLCLEFPSGSPAIGGFISEAAGNIDRDPAIDHAQVTDGNRAIVILADDVAN